MTLRAAPLLLLAVAIPAHADERRFMLTNFDRIRVDGPFDVTVVAGPSAGAVAIGEGRGLDSVDVRIQDRVLIVSPNVNAWGSYPGAALSAPRVTVTVPVLRSAAVVGGGRLTIDRMRGQAIDLKLTGSGIVTVGDAQADRIDAVLIGTGQVTLAGRALRAGFQSSGAGAIDAHALAVGALTVTWQSAGDGRFAARDTAAIYAVGQGVITVDGTPACTVRGNGPVSCGAK